REVSRTARVSLGYLSEVERGRKEASSELLAAICEALDLPLWELLHLVASDIGAVQQPVPTTAELTERAPASASAAGLEGGTMVPAVIGNDLSDLRLQPVLTHRLSTSISKPRNAVVAA
ncbi:MAG: helix-turn-helix transcriptional regulator, partial [Saccharothrix sp.]|nr:helix-turn-helix transcriptional regulator [Saccharothrix sp.]